MSLVTRVQALATRIANEIRDAIKPRLIPAGGTLGQMLRKAGSGDYLVDWMTLHAVAFSGSYYDLADKPTTIVMGPGSVVDNFVPRFDGASGALLQSSRLVIDDLGKVLVNADTTVTGNVIDIQRAGATVFGMNISGRMTMRGNGSVLYLDWFGSDRSGSLGLNGANFQMTGSFQSNTDSTGISRFSAANGNTVTSYFQLYDEAVAHIMAQRNGVNPQAFRVYNSWGSAVNFERAVIDWKTTANVLTIGAQAGGTGGLRPVEIVGGSVKVSAPLQTTGTLTLKAGVGSVTWPGAGGIRTGDGTTSGFVCINSGTLGDNTLYLNLDNPTAPVSASNMLINIAGAPANRALSQVNAMDAGLVGSYSLTAWAGQAYKVPSAAFCTVANGGATPVEYLPVAVWGRTGAGGASYNNIAEWKIGRWGNPGDTSAASALTLALLNSNGGNAGTDVMTWESRGRVGVNTKTPTAALHVVGNIVVTGTVDGRDISVDGATLDAVPAAIAAIWVKLTQAEYDALAVKNPATLYVIVG